MIHSSKCPEDLTDITCYSFQDNIAFDSNRECITENDEVQNIYTNLKGYVNSQKIMISNLIQDFGGLTSDTAQFKVKINKSIIKCVIRWKK